LFICIENLVPVGSRLRSNFFRLSPVLLLWDDPKKEQEKSPLGAGPAISLCKGYPLHVEHSAEFLTPAAAPTSLRDSGPVNQHSEARYAQAPAGIQ